MPLNILLVDDNPDAADLMQELLSMEGHTIRTATTAKQALALAHEQPAQVFLLDQNLPDMLGSELLPLLRASVKQHGAGPCFGIAITGLASSVGTGEQGGGFDYVLEKPLDFDAFDAVLSRCASALAQPAA
jgi:CheY-like chemotaxis protein